MAIISSLFLAYVIDISQLPHLEQDIRELVDDDAQADPKFQTTFRYLKVSAQRVRDKLILEKGYEDEDLPCRQTIGDILNRLDYRLRKR